jgi:hypothetical protein
MQGQLRAVDSVCNKKFNMEDVTKTNAMRKVCRPQAL